MEPQSGRRAHAEFMDELVTSGFLLLGRPPPDEHRVILVIEAASEDAIRERLARDPWIDTHLSIDSIERWAIRLDGLHR